MIDLPRSLDRLLGNVFCSLRLLARFALPALHLRCPRTGEHSEGVPLTLVGEAEEIDCSLCFVESGCIVDSFNSIGVAAIEVVGFRWEAVEAELFEHMDEQVGLYFVDL